MDSSLLYFQKWSFKVAMVLLIVGGLNWLLVGLFGLDLVRFILGKGVVAKTVYVLVGISALAIMFNRDTYLPFLGETVMPCGIFAESKPEGADTEVSVLVPPGAKVLYWAAEPSTEGLKDLKTWKGAYLAYKNAGVTVANKQGIATLRVRKPQPYTVPFKGRLESHIHFRICSESGMLGRIKTVFLSDGHVEGFLA